MGKRGPHAAAKRRRELAKQEKRQAKLERRSQKAEERSQLQDLEPEAVPEGDGDSA
jgi:hypothetical protein